MRQLIVNLSALVLFLNIINVVKAETIKATVYVSAKPQYLLGPYESPESSINSPSDKGGDVTFFAKAIAPESANYYFIVCKSGEVESLINNPPTCPGGKWCISELTPSANISKCSYNIPNQISESNDWYGFICNPATGSCTDSTQGTGNTGSPFYVNPTSGVVLAAKDNALGLGGLDIDIASRSNQLDIKNIKMRDVFSGENILTEITLSNLSSEDKLIDYLALIATQLDGTIKLSEGIKINEQLPPAKEKILDYGFPSNLKPGEYIGIIEIYSQGKLLGQSKTILSIRPQTPKILGVSSTNYDYFPLFIAVVFAGILISGIFIILKFGSIVLSKISLNSFNIILVATGMSVVGFGLLGGYALTEVYFQLGASSISYDYFPFLTTLIFAGFSIVGVFVLYKFGSILKSKTSLSLFDVVAIATGVSAVGFGLFIGYTICELLYRQLLFANIL